MKQNVDESEEKESVMRAVWLMKQDMRVCYVG